jgi:hypothetical protein
LLSLHCDAEWAIMGAGRSASRFQRLHCTLPRKSCITPPP